MGKTILIIGATSGLGKRLAELYCIEGYKVGVVGRRKNLLDELQNNYPQNIVPFHFNINSADCTESITGFIQALNGIDKLIITASVVDLNPHLSFEIEKEIFDTNIYGYAAVLNAAYHYFKSKGSGHIIGVTSIAGARGNNSTPAYNATKAFQSSYLESLRLNLLNLKKQVFITELIPGYMDTQMAKGNRLFWMASLDKSAKQAKKAIDKKLRKAFITRRWQLVYYIYKLMPTFIYTYIINSKLKFQKRN